MHSSTGEKKYAYYVLSQSQTRYTRISAALVSKYEALRRGEKPHATAGKFSLCVEIMNALHKVEEREANDPEIAPNEMNPLFLKCNICKAFAMLGVCSHTLTVTHMLLSDKSTECHPCYLDVNKMSLEIDEKDKKMRGADANAKSNTGAKALEKRTSAKAGAYANKKSAVETARKKDKATAKKGGADAATTSPTKAISKEKKKEAMDKEREARKNDREKAKKKKK